jgi:hypothetical protein
MTTSWLSSSKENESDHIRKHWAALNFQGEQQSWVCLKIGYPWLSHSIHLPSNVLPHIKWLSFGAPFSDTLHFWPWIEATLPKGLSVGMASAREGSWNMVGKEIPLQAGAP